MDNQCNIYILNNILITCVILRKSLFILIFQFNKIIFAFYAHITQCENKVVFLCTQYTYTYEQLHRRGR